MIQEAPAIIRPRKVIAANDNGPVFSHHSKPQSDYDRGFQAGWLARLAEELK